MGKQQKPKIQVKMVEDSSRRQNGKAPKKKPKTPVAKGKSLGGYSEAALARREARRAPVTLQGLIK